MYFWLNPEPRERWNTEDSVIGLYAPFCDGVYQCQNLEQLTDAVKAYHLKEGRQITYDKYRRNRRMVHKLLGMRPLIYSPWGFCAQKQDSDVILERD